MYYAITELIVTLIALLFQLVQANGPVDYMQHVIEKHACAKYIQKFSNLNCVN